MKTFKINYDKKVLYVVYDGKPFTFDMSKHTIGDFWEELVDSEGLTWSIRFNQVDKRARPKLSTYRNVFEEENPYYIFLDEDNPIPFEFMGSTGNPDNYFGNKE